MTTRMKRIRQSDIREHNLQNVYEYVLHNSNVSRAKLAKALDLSKPTSSSLVDELLSIGALFEDGEKEEDGCVGRNPMLIKADFRSFFCIVLFWKASSIEASVVSMCQEWTEEKRVIYSSPFAVPSPEYYGKRSIEIIRVLKSELEKNHYYMGTSIMLSGIVDIHRKGILSYPLNIDELTGKKIVSDIVDSGENAIAIFNDNVILGFSAMNHFQLQQRNFLYIHFLTGIGAAYFMKGQVFGDAGGKLTQFGHCIVCPNGKQCRCGAFGCLEAEIGEIALRGEIRKYCESIENFPLGEGKYLEWLIRRKEGDFTFFSEVKKEYIRDLAFAICNASTMVFPDLILLGGYFYLWGEEFLGELEEEIQRTGFSYIMQDLHLQYCKERKEEIQVACADYLFSRYYRFTSRKIEGIHLG
ncbi:ROK family protein [Oribacterium parvum]|uniref:ROK family protein n=1 Tax=Oribacterium parvum TaxID=1501329 RepID=UPI0028E437EA|nr:ROK family protein [Oribacterium parvum]